MTLYSTSDLFDGSYSTTIYFHFSQKLYILLAKTMDIKQQANNMSIFTILENKRVGGRGLGGCREEFICIYIVVIIVF